MLTRNVDMLRSLVASGVDLVFSDLPHVPPGAMGRFLLTQVASVAELEAARQPWQPQRPVAFGSATQTARALKGKQVGNREAIAKVKANARERASNLSAILLRTFEPKGSPVFGVSPTS